MPLIMKIDICYLGGIFERIKSIVIRINSCNKLKECIGVGYGTLYSVFGAQYYPQDLVLPFDPRSKI